MANKGMADIKKIKEAARLILKDEITHLQIVPSVAIKLLNLTSNDSTRIEDLSRIIETEPTLAAKVLRNINSAAYALPNKISSIKYAVNILGFAAVRQLALNLLLYNKLIKHNPKQKFDPLFFWQHCLFVATLSKVTAIAIKHPNPDLVYTAGLMHDIGKVILESHGRVTYSDFISSINKSDRSTLEQEHDFFGLTHADIGHIFCLEWQLPASITAVVAHHHTQTTETSPYAEFKTEIAIVSFANYIAWMQGIGSASHNSHPVLQHTAMETIDINQLNIEDMLEHVDQEMQSAQEFYGIQFPCLTKLRATLIKATITLSQMHADKLDGASNGKPLSSLTAPHQSLIPDDFVPQTLEALQREFSFDRSIMLNIAPKHRCLIASYWWPKSILPTQLQPFEIDISTVSGKLLKCLREKKSVILNDKEDPDNAIFKRLNVSEFIAVPVLHHNRLIGVLYADNGISKKPMSKELPSKITPIAHELGVALFNANQYAIEKKRAQLDPLTQLFNKRMIDDFLFNIFQQEDISNRAHIAVGFVDIDKFKLFNDLCGHQAGDDALRIVADILRSLTRPRDFIGRYGGEEFVFVLKNTDEAGAYGYAERIRTEIERRGKIMSHRFHNHLLTVSVGVAMHNEQYSSHTEMIEAADQAMYCAKNEGRNRVVMLTNTTPDSKINTAPALRK